jgi:predicted metal-binding membrane protein
MSLVWIVGVALLIEKSLPWGARVCGVTGAVLVV